MEPSDLPLVVPLKRTTFAMFADDIGELEGLREAVAAPARPPSASSSQQRDEAPPPPPQPASPPPKGKGKAKAPVVPTPEPDPTPEPAATPPPPVADPWAEHVERLQKELDDHVADTAPFNAFEAKRLGFFAQKPAEDYLIEDVLCERDTPPERVPETCIDAVAMSRAHAAAMEQRFGYRAPRGLDTAGHVRPEDLPDQSRHGDLLHTHDAGGAGEGSEFVCGATLRGEGSVAKGAAKLGGTTASKRGGAKAQDGQAAVSLGATQQSMASFGSASDFGAGATKVKAAAPPPGTKNATLSPQTKRLQSVRGAGVPDLVVETSLQQFHFPQCSPGTQYELRCRVWNRDTSSRRFKLKIQGDTAKLLQLQTVTPGFTTEVAVVPGNSFEFALVYSPVTTDPLDCQLVIGHARDINRTAQDNNTHSQWQFRDLPVTSTCLAPELDLGKIDTSFEPCFVGSSRVVRAEAVNVGCAGFLAIASTCPQLSCSESVLTLQHGESCGVEFNFAPDAVGAFHGAVTVRGFLPSQDMADPNEVPVSEMTIAFDGEGVAPVVKVSSFGDAVMPNPDGGDEASSPPSPTTAAAVLPYLVVEEACVGHASTRVAVVENTCSLPVRVGWTIETSGDCRVAMSPAECTLAPRETRQFTLSVLPLSLAATRQSKNGSVANSANGAKERAFEAIVALVLRDVPRVAAALAARISHRSFVKPKLRAKGGAKSAAAAVAKPADPFGVFSPRLVEKSGAHSAAAAHADPKALPTHTGKHDEGDEPGSDEHFCAAVRVMADPVTPSIEATPSVLVAEAPCLVQQSNTREVVLMNSGLRDVQLWIDPPAGAEHPAVELESVLTPNADATEVASAFAKLCRGRCLPNQRHDLDVVVTPQRFTLAGGKSKTVTIAYTAKRAGDISASIEVYSPILEAPPVVSLSLVARGPELTISPSTLEYGVIPVGGEAEGRVTLTNSNPIPVMFSLLDTQAAQTVTTLSLDGGDSHGGPSEDGPTDEDRMVFLPASGSLAPRESRDITVYLRGHHEGPVDDRIRVAVDEGVASYVTVRASVQAPRVCVSPATTTMARVQRNVPVECTTYLTNLSAVDTYFDVVPVDVPSGMHVDILGDTNGLLHSGAADVPLHFRVVFSGLKPQVALMAVKSEQLADPVLFELTCDKVEQLAVSVGVTTPDAPESLLTTDEYCCGLVEDMVLAAVMDSEGVTFLGDQGDDDADASSSAEPKLTMRCPCPPIVASGTIDSEMPFTVSTAAITLTNLSGCYTNVSFGIGNFRPPSVEDLATARGTPTPTPPVATTTQKKPAARSSSGTAGHKSTRLAPLDAKKPQTASSMTAGSKAPGDQLYSGASATSRKTMKQALALSSGTAGKTFTCKAINGLEEKETHERAVLGDAQRALIHGAGFAIELSELTHALQPFESVTVDVRLIANIPGHYTDAVNISIDNMPSTRVPVTFHVEGKPVVLDPFTSGLTVGPTGVARLQMPPIVPGVPVVKRTLTVTSRCPRELALTAKLVEWGQALKLNAAFDDAAGRVSLALESRVDPGAEAPACSAQVSPAQVVLPALQTTQVTISYAPPENPSKDFHASLIFSTEPADTVGNDRFIVDEFYKLNAARFPGTTRTLTQQTVIAKEGITVRGVPKVLVRPPLVERKGIAQGSVILPLDENARLAAATADRTPGSSGGQNQLTSSHEHADDDDDDSDDDVAAKKSHEDEALEKRLKAAKVASRALVAEREELVNFVAMRRHEMKRMWRVHARPMELEVHVAHLAPKLVTDPPSVLRLPMCKRSAIGTSANASINSRTINLSNEGTAPVDFRLEISQGPFRVSKAQLRAENKGKLVNFADTKLGQTLGGCGLVAGSRRPASRESDPVMQLFRLRPFDVLVVTVELVDAADFVKQRIEGQMNIAFASGGHVQSVPLLATVHVPVVDVEHPSVTFRPTVAVANGRKQPVYKRIVRLVNPSLCDAPFVIRHAPADRPVTRRTKPADRATVVKAAQTAIAGDEAGFDGRKTLSKTTTALGATGGPAEANNVSVDFDGDEALPVDDPSRFVIETVTGTVPAATLGSKPTVLEVAVTFREHAVTHFESTFLVEVDGGVGSRFTLYGESRGTEME